MIPQYDVSLVRGDSWERVVGLAQGFAVDPAWIGRFVIREAQDDDLTDLLSIELPIDLDPVPEPCFPSMSGIFTIHLTPNQTQGLPPYDLVCFCEVRTLDGAEVQRLFQGKVKVSD